MFCRMGAARPVKIRNRRTLNVNASNHLPGCRALFNRLPDGCQPLADFILASRYQCRQIGTDPDPAERPAQGNDSFHGHVTFIEVMPHEAVHLQIHQRRDDQRRRTRRGISMIDTRDHTALHMDRESLSGCQATA